MHDPYLYDDVPVLKNKLDIKQQRQLDDAEADYVVYRLKDLAMNPLPGNYHTEHLLAMHKFIFQDLYTTRKYKKSAIVPQLYPFRYIYSYP